MISYLIFGFLGIFSILDIGSNLGRRITLKYAKKHLLWLISKLGNNPLFVSYAYNGGIGFTKRKVIPYFGKLEKFEPFLSMEMVPYSESREYGKKVITNYIIYMNMFDKNITLHKLFQNFSN